MILGPIDRVLWPPPRWQSFVCLLQSEQLIIIGTLPSFTGENWALSIWAGRCVQISNITDVNCQVLCGLCYSGWMGGKRKNEENFRGKHSRRWFAEEWKQRKLYSRTENIKRNAREKYLKVSEINVPKVLFCLGHSNAVRNYSPGRNLYLLSSINI